MRFALYGALLSLLRFRKIPAEAKGYCHAIETDFANQTTAAAMVRIATSKPISATAGNSTDPIALLRDGQHHGYKMLGACASCDRRKIEKNGGRDRDRTCDPYHVMPCGSSR